MLKEKESKLVVKKRCEKKGSKGAPTDQAFKRIRKMQKKESLKKSQRPRKAHPKYT